MHARIVYDQGWWDRFAADSPGGTLFHRWKFLEIMEKYSSFKMLPYAVFRGEEPVCIFPLFYRSYGGLKAVFSPPLQTNVPYLGPAFSEGYYGLRQRRKESYLNDAVEEVNREIARLSPSYVAVDAAPGFDDVRPFLWSGYDVDVKYTYVIDLARPLDRIWEGFDASCKKRIRRCEHTAPEIRRSEDTRAFYQIMDERLRLKGQSSVYGSQSHEYLRDILTAFPENVKMHFLCDHGISGVQVTCEYRDTLLLWLGSANGHYNEYLIWELIKRAKAAGLRRFEIYDGHTRRLTPFKSKFGPGLEKCYSVSRKNIFGTCARWAYIALAKARSATVSGRLPEGE
ncbi:GNAT family N-acetyltransferase [Methanocella arvoryzae]|uniref:BioF2-like acetyltransferase domain-containing protein n=1 Tax=Methanocella arvoryzae (strain DSM 22066 / NBRC 105507 / MRE50) TaxID=351160 RepID=Q0W3C8_METAR|nr:GNAT family N-acetyltransferase [Methanocella arvoryzae]CAJ37115.1 conserved hypothetical protein [Methanocella arvoryzae MRE50]